MPKPISYADAGVSIDKANEAVARIREHARSTFNERTLTEIGSFGGMFSGAFPQMSEPILVASADGVGTKLKLAFETGIHNSVGADLVNHCVNDILVQGARPLFFLDYFATGKLEPDVTASVVEGMARACKENGCVLLGGETAEMPDFYPPGEYDLAGFIVGVVDKKNIIDGRRIKPGDVVLGLKSNGLHTNGYSLARKILFERMRLKPSSKLPQLGRTVGDELLRVHKNYQPMLARLRLGMIKGLAHITGGGLIDNLPRILPRNCDAVIETGSWRIPEIFQILQEKGKVPREEMYQVFNMGIGMAVIVAPGDASRAKSLLKAIEIGVIQPGTGKTRLVF